jgi:hypothetical protein
MPDSPSSRHLPAIKFPDDDEVTGEIFALDRSTRPDIAFHRLGLGERMVPAISVVMGAMFGKVVRLEGELYAQARALRPQARRQG